MFVNIRKGDKWDFIIFEDDSQPYNRIYVVGKDEDLNWYTKNMMNDDPFSRPMAPVDRLEPAYQEEIKNYCQQWRLHPDQMAQAILEYHFRNDGSTKEN